MNHMPSGHRPPIPPPLARVTLFGTTMTHKWAQVFYLNVGGASVTASDLNTLASAIDGYWATNIQPLVPSTVVLNGVNIVYIPSVGNELLGSSTIQHVGTRAGTQINDAACSFLINWHISAYYRGGHPRSYQAAPITTDVTNGSQVSSTIPSSLTSAWAAFMASINAYTAGGITSLVMGTCSFQTNNSWRTPPVFRPYTGVACSTLVASQRRRIRS